MPSEAGPAAASPSASTKGDRTRRRLLDAAAAEVARHGPAGASLTGIAAAAGLRTGSIYFHFPSKEHLVEAVLEEGLRESLRHLTGALDGHPDPADPAARLRAAMRGHLAALDDLQDYAIAVLAPRFAAPPGALASFRALRRDYLERWSGLITDAQRAGQLPRDLDPRAVRDVLLGALNAAGLAGRPAAETEATVAALLHLDTPADTPADAPADPDDLR